MGSFSLFHWMIILLVVLLLFGGSRLSGVMGEFAKGLKAFKQGMREDEPGTPAAPPQPSPLQHDSSYRPEPGVAQAVSRNPAEAEKDRRVS